ncbi:MAG: sodium:cation symporter [Candidatus Paralactobacillus gallistercoris]|uniref:Sodium:cation symporter n=1 Tax=Candidatus Paralactobacillus gallistercoris TaxID=2838724 RepID=A0A948X0R7_9LACO|nr:sodium:cation symporter [Candidatus Paralactobacillus gallistercoris]
MEDNSLILSRKKRFINNLKHFFSDKLMIVAIIAALITSLLTPPHMADVNWHVIVNVFCIMAMVQIFEHLHVLEFFATHLISSSRTERHLMQMLLLLTFFGAMFLTNDMTVLTFVPLVILIAIRCNFSPIMPITLLTIAANLGSSLMPFGSPHNITIVSYYNISIGKFFSYSLPLMLFSLLVLGICSFLFPNKPVEVGQLEDIKIDKGPLLVFVPLTLLIFTSVIINNITWLKWVVLALVLITVTIYRPQTFKQIDYGLLVTFFCFFIAVGNLSRLPSINHLLAAISATDVRTYLAGLLSCQFMSNVPTAILMSRFTHCAQALFLAVNIGGLGTLIASVANMIAYKHYKTGYGKHVGKFLFIFMGVNILALLLFGFFGYLMLSH